LLGHADVTSTQVCTEVAGQMQADGVERLPRKLT
jgi:site-specific recombinase XerD